MGGYCQIEANWHAGLFRDCNGVSNGRPLEPAAIAAENQAIARGDSRGANLLVVSAGYGAGGVGYGAGGAGYGAGGAGYGAGGAGYGAGVAGSDGYGLTGTLESFPNGAVVPADVPAVVAARANHIAAVAALRV